MHNEHASTELQTTETILRIQRDIAIALSSERDLPTALHRLLAIIFEIEGIDCGGVYTMDDASGALQLIAHSGLPPQFVESASYYTADSPQTRLVMNGQPIYRYFPDLLPDAKAEPLHREGLRAIGVIPVLCEGRVIAVLNLASHTHDEIPTQARHALEATAAQIGGIIARVKAEEQLQQYADELEATNAELAQYTYIVSHDLKAPLRAIHNYADFLQEDLETVLDKEQKTFLEGIHRAIQEAHELVNALLEFSQIGQRPAEVEMVDVGTLLHSLSMSPELSEDIEVSMDDHWPHIMVEPILFRKIFQHLIRNAVTFNTSSPKRIKLGWRASRQDHYEFFIQDNGIGVAPEYQEQIFRVFERLHTKEEFPGTGIGLAIVKKAVGKLGGALRLESAPGEGSTFFVTLPKHSGKSL